MMGWYPNGWGAMGVLGMVLMVAVWAVIIAGAIWLIARATRTEHPAGVEHEPGRTILDRRFAAGEIDAQEYASARRTLESPGTESSATPGA
ncbi:MAG: SHOCT domain-containing protein [Actinomycetota bacterium]|nr:SHOCT domain-containing protein [Actinomycetota bacterium]